MAFVFAFIARKINKPERSASAIVDIFNAWFIATHTMIFLSLKVHVTSVTTSDTAAFRTAALGPRLPMS